jgi:hypothetical protein
MDPQFGEMLDTSQEARVRYYELLARMTPGERARKVAALGRAARELARAGIRLRHPQATASAIELELIGRLYGDDVAARLAPRVLNADRD